jgi:hypothetical protein
MATTTDASVTVIVPTVEQPIVLARALTSLRDQSETVRVLVVNNGGDPAPVDQVVASITSSSTPLSTHLTVQHRSRHDERGALIKDALADVSTPYVAILDDSQTWRATCAAVAVTCLVDNPNAAAVCVGYDVAHEKMIEERVWPRRNEAMSRQIGDVSLASLLSGVNIPEHSMIYRTQAIRDAGGVNDTLTHLVMWDLNVRLASTSHIAVVKTPLVTLHVRESDSETEEKTRQSVEDERHVLVSSWLNETLPGGANKGQCALDALAYRNREDELRQLREENAALRKEIANFHGLSSRALRAALQPKKLLRAVQRRTKK